MTNWKKDSKKGSQSKARRVKQREREEEKRKEKAAKASVLPSQANTMDIQEPQTSTRKLKGTCKKLNELNARNSSGIPKQKRLRKIR